MRPAISAPAPDFTETTKAFVAGSVALSLLVLVLLVLVIGPPGVS